MGMNVGLKLFILQKEFNPEDFYADDQMVITISHMGYIKRTPLSNSVLKIGGGVGSKGRNP